MCEYEKENSMNKKWIISSLTSAALLTGGLFSQKTTPLQAATKTLTIKQKTPLYTTNGKKTGEYVAAKTVFTYSSSKKIKIGQKYYLAYYLPKKKAWVLKANVTLNKATSKKVYRKSSLTLPTGYTRSALLAAFKGNPSKSFKKSCVEGMNDNSFSRIANLSESKKDDTTKVNLNKLTSEQKRELSEYILRLINQARTQLGLPAWKYSSSAQALANDIASEYVKGNWSISDQRGHYVAGITKACKKNGFSGPLIEDNYVENMAGFLSTKNTLTITQIKKDIYFSLKQMIFGYAGSSESERNNPSKYIEWQHAASIFNTQGSSHDGDWDYFAFSISNKGKAYSLHFICIPSFAVKQYHQGTWK